MTPIATFRMPANHKWHPNQEFGVGEDGSILILTDAGWRISAYDDSDVVHLAMRTALATTPPTPSTQ